MNNEQKAELYHSYLLRHDKLESQIADIKSEAAGRDLNEEQINRLLEIADRCPVHRTLHKEVKITTRLKETV